VSDFLQPAANAGELLARGRRGPFFNVTHLEGGDMKRHTNLQDVDRWARRGVFASKVGGLLMVLALIGAIFAHAPETLTDSHAAAGRTFGAAPEPATPVYYFPSQFGTITTQASEQPPTF
jgi:hypothetical protein